jgi:hypothetical protein
VAFARSGKPSGKPGLAKIRHPPSSNKAALNNHRSQRFLKPGGIGMSEGIFRPSEAGLPQEMLDAKICAHSVRREARWSN